MENDTNRQKHVFTVESGLRKYMISVFNKMFLAMCLTGITAFICVSSSDIMKVMTGGVSVFLMIVQFGIVIYLGARFNKMSSDKAGALFWIYSAIMGAFLSPIAVVYTGASIANAFFMAACFFAGMSLYGYTTKKDLSSVGSFMRVGLICLILTSVINIFFLKSSGLELGISALLVLIFAGLTAFDVQKITSVYSRADSEEIASKKAIFGALTLYLDFLNMFLAILRLFGSRR